jgi:ectoine hydroxylase-related dioxygenase (phytanoyl-CoA dioxygenase family)
MDLGTLRQQVHNEGYAILPCLLSVQELQAARDALDAAVAAMRLLGVPTHTASLDPNASNVRVYNLPELSPVFVDLLRHPAALSMVHEVLSRHCLVSNFTGNIAWPGAGSMNLHSDQALVIPPPWNEPWACNVIWCLDDVHERNGATRYLPGSHNYRTFEDVPADALSRARAFEAPAGSAILMEGRLWHTSGANVTRDERRAMLFAYYSADFIRQQINWEAVLSPKTKESFDAETHKLFGLGPAANTRIGGQLTRLRSSH